LEVNFNNTHHITYDANGNERIEEQNNTNSAFANDLDEAQKDTNKTNSVFADSTEEANENTEKIAKEDEEATTEALLEELMFTFRTGMTKDEYEELQDKLKELQDKIKEGNYTEDEVTQMLKEIERDILRIKKEVSGEAIKELSNSLGELGKAIGDNPEKATDLIQQLLDRVADANKQLENLEKGKDKKGFGNGNTTEELELLQRLKQTAL